MKIAGPNTGETRHYPIYLLGKNAPCPWRRVFWAFGYTKKNEPGAEPQKYSID